MAADSAVTVYGKKSFDGNKKLFKISNDPPFAMFAFGNADFGLVSIETIIETFREKLSGVETIEEIFDLFINHVGEITFPDDVERFVLTNLSEFKEILKLEFDEISSQDFKRFLKDSEKQEIYDFLNEFEISFGDILPDFADESEVKEDLLEIFSHWLSKCGTGLVIAGFNKSDIHPSVIYFNLIINNNSKIEYNFHYLLNNINRAYLIPFAQSEEIMTFITGINECLEKELLYHDEDLLNNLHAFFKKTGEFSDEVMLKIADLNEEFLVYNNYHKNDLKSKIDDFKLEFSEDMFFVLECIPNVELANLAEFLIYLTACKRKYSLDLNSVGGDIDVALITKNSFKWIKHKKI